MRIDPDQILMVINKIDTDLSRRIFLQLSSGSEILIPGFTELVLFSELVLLKVKWYSNQSFKK